MQNKVRWKGYDVLLPLYSNLVKIGGKKDVVNFLEDNFGEGYDIESLFADGLGIFRYKNTYFFERD